MAVINPKQLKISVPDTVNSILERSLKNGEGWVVSKTYDKEKDMSFYLLPGLYIRNLSGANLTDETSGKLDNGLNSGAIQYVIYPGDRRAGYIPILFDRDTKFYFEEQLQELLSSKNINWYIFKVPIDVDIDDNERVGSEMVKDVAHDNEPITIGYDEIETTLRKMGRVDEDTRGSMFDDSVEADARERKKIEEELANEKKENIDIEQNVDKDSLDRRIENIKQNVDDDSEEETEETNDEDESDTDDDDLISDLDDSPPVSNNDTLAGLFDNEDVILPDNNESIETENVGSLNMFDDPIETDDQSDVQKDEETKATVSKDESYNEYKNHPEDLQKVLDRIKLPMFKPFLGEHLSDETREQMNHFIDNINENIKSLESNIKDKAITLYENDMNGSYEVVKNHLDPEKGDDFIRERYQNIQKQINDFHDKADQKATEYHKQLQEDFDGPQYEAYKEEILATLYQKFKDEYYGERVLLPTEEFEEKQKAEAEDKAREVRNEFDDWRSNLETTAITADQERAINHVKSSANEEIEKAMSQINEYRMSLEKQKNTLQSQDIAQRSAESFKAKLQDEAVQAVIQQIADQYGPEVAQQAKQLDEFKQKLHDEQQASASKDEELKHKEQLAKERAERERRQIEDEKRELERKRREFEEERQRIYQNQGVLSSYQQPVVQQAPQVPQQTNESNTTQNSEKLKGFGEKKLTPAKKTAVGIVGGLILVGGGVYAGHELYDMGSHDYAGKEEKVKQQQQADVVKQSSDDTPYLDDGNVSVPKDDYAKGDQLKYQDKKYDVENVSKNMLKIKAPNGDEFQVPIKNK